MASYSRVIIVGHLCRDPEIKHLQSGTAVTDNSVAVNDKRKNPSGEWLDEVSFIDVTLFGRSAEVLGEYCHKGSLVLIEGKLKQERWEDRNTHDKRSKVKVIGDRLVLLGSKPQGEQQERHYDRSEAQAEPAFTPQASPDVGSQAEPEDSLPF